MMKRALILVDIQNDFMKGGSLEVPNANEILPIVNDLMKKEWDLIVATKDWHPAYHKSFASQYDDKNVFDVIDLHGIEQVLWPNHCIQGSIGAQLHDELDVELIDEFIVKGTNQLIDSYSGFFDNGQVLETDLADLLDERSIDKVYIVGLATDYCVKFTALDAYDLGFETYLIVDTVRGLDGAEDAIIEMQDRGVYLTTSEVIE